MTRREFSVATKQAAYDRSGGKCECGCGRPFGDHPKARPVYDHRQADNLDGEPTLENCHVLRWDCHKIKTAADMKMIAKARRGEKARQGIKPRKAKIPGSKGTGLRKKMDGSVVRVKE